MAYGNALLNKNRTAPILSRFEISGTVCGVGCSNVLA